jgi:hypothetical protein
LDVIWYIRKGLNRLPDFSLGIFLQNIKGKGKMNILSKTLVPLFLGVILLASCNSVQSTPTLSDADIMKTAISTVSTAFAETQRAMPTTTPDPHLLPTFSFINTLDTLTPYPTLPSRTPLPTIPTFTPLVFSDPSIPLSERIVYYYPVWSENPIPEGTIRAGFLFAPAYTDETFTSDTAADITRALEIILHEDSRRVWGTSDLEIVEVTFRNGHAAVVLQGETTAAGDSQPCAGGLQILMTVFANPSVQTAAVSLNGGTTIGNLCFFGPPTPPIIPHVNGVYARADIEAYMKENAYVSTATPSSVIQVEVYADQDWQETGVTVQVNDMVEVKYIAGAWSIYTPWGSVDPEGYSFAPTPLNPMPDAQPGELIGKIGQSLFRIGRQVEFTSQSEGLLYLRINDDSLEDNRGRLLVQIIVRTP